jgi:hypothetical protein
MAFWDEIRKGEGLRFVVQGTDVMLPRPLKVMQKSSKPLVYARHQDAVNWGVHRTHRGGKRGRYLLSQRNNHKKVVKAISRNRTATRVAL